MKDKVLATIKSNNMLKKGDKVIVGLSGGADSVALLCVLQSLEKELGITLSAIHVNHCLRGEESDRDERFCAELCSEKGISFTAVRVDVNSYCDRHKTGTEEGARALRYSVFEQADPAAKIATAHTLSDNAETVIMNLARGTALDGLCGIPPVRGRIIRPIIDCSRADVEKFLAEIGQDFVTDSTNLTDDYNRNRVRHNIIPLLKQLNPELERSVKKSCDALRKDRALLELMAENAMKAARLPEKAASPRLGRLNTLCDRRESFSADLLISQPQPVRMRIYKALLESFSLRFDSARLERIDSLLQSEGGVYSLSGSAFIKKDGERLFVERKAAACPTEPVAVDIKRELPFEMKIYGGVLKVRALDKAEIKLFVNNRSFQFKNSIDCDKINSTILIRPRKQGERIALIGRKCTQTFKNLFNAAGLSSAERDSLLVCESGGDAVWLEGFGACEGVCLTPLTENAIIFEISEEKQHEK